MPFYVIGGNMVSIKVLNSAKKIIACILLFSASGAIFSNRAMNGTVYCCNDSSGKQVCGDILPQACIGRAYREVGRSGTTLRHVSAPMTAEQRAQRQAEEEQRKIEAAKRKEQELKDRALLETYGNERDIEAMRTRAENDILQAISAAESKIETAKKGRKKFEDEAEFYQKKPMPPDVKKGLKEADIEIEAQESVIVAKKKELETVRAKYDEEKARFIELSKRPPPRSR